MCDFPHFLEHGNHVTSQRPFWINQHVTVSNFGEIKKKDLTYYVCESFII